MKKIIVIIALGTGIIANADLKVKLENGDPKVGTKCLSITSPAISENPESLQTFINIQTAAAEFQKRKIISVSMINKSSGAIVCVTSEATE
jgi:hypothetical protein